MSTPARRSPPPDPCAADASSRFGYSHPPATIEDIFTDGLWMPQRRSWVAPQVRTMRRAFEEDTWSGTGRNVHQRQPML